jgi:predicted transposase YbfD/YdcC
LEVIDITGDVVTIDAMGCQTGIAKRIVDKEADYVLAVRENHWYILRKIALAQLRAIAIPN